MVPPGVSLNTGLFLFHLDARLLVYTGAHLIHNVARSCPFGVPVIGLGRHSGSVRVETGEISRIEGPLFFHIKGQAAGCDLIVVIFAGIIGDTAVVPGHRGIDLVSVDGLITARALDCLFSRDVGTAELHIVLIIRHVDAGETPQVSGVLKLPGQIKDFLRVLFEQIRAVVLRYLERDKPLRH